MRRWRGFVRLESCCKYAEVRGADFGSTLYRDVEYILVFTEGNERNPLMNA